MKKPELFRAECRPGDRTMAILGEAFPGVEAEVRRQSDCVDGRCCAPAAEYEVRAVPSLEVGGRVQLVGPPG